MTILIQKFNVAGKEFHLIKLENGNSLVDDGVNIIATIESNIVKMMKIESGKIIYDAYIEQKEGPPIDFCNLNRPSVAVTLEIFPCTSHTEILTHWIRSA